MHVIITRPIEDSLELIRNLKIINHTITYLPLISVRKISNKNINFHNFSCKKKNTVKNIFNQIKKNYFLGKEKLLLSLSDQYKYSFDVKKISK